MNFLQRTILPILFLCLFFYTLSFSQDYDRPEPLPEIDVRMERVSDPSRTISEAKKKSYEEMQTVFPGFKVDWNNFTGNATMIRNLNELLTKPSIESPETVALNFIRTNEPLFGLQENELDRLEISQNLINQNSGLQRIIFQQKVNEIPVYGGTYYANLTANQEMINCGSNLMPSITNKIRTKKAKVKPQQAIAAALKSINGTLKGELTVKEKVDGPTRKTVFAAGENFSIDVPIELNYWPVSPQEVRLVWNMYIGQQEDDFIYQVFVDAQSGEVVFRASATASDGIPQWLVFISDSPSPMSPGTATPDGTQPPNVARRLVETNGDPVASPNGWIPAAGTTTTGNNVDAFIDSNNDGTPDVARPSSATQVFSFPLDLTAAPTTVDNRNSAVVNAFYWANWFHDKMYEYGFNEKAGNFQDDNFGRGGAGGDHVQVRVESGLNNSTFFTAADGNMGIWRSFLFDGPNPDRSAAFDQEISIHELTHGLTNRLVGGPGLTMTGNQPRAMGEGWSDFYAFTLLAEEGDDLNGTFALGAYSLFHWAPAGAGWDDNYYYGIRRFPHSRDMSKSPMTFADIDPAQFGFDASIPTSPWLTGIPAGQVHNAGEIWCAALMECRANFIEFYGHETGTDLILQLVTDGLTLIPTNTPTYIQARDAIFAADINLTGGANHCLLWKGFSKRGMGPDAVAPPYYTTTGVVEDFYDVLEEPTAVITEPTCPGSCDGAIDLTIVGGEAPFTISWNTGASTEDLSGLCAGTYTVMITDALGCPVGVSFTIPDGIDTTPPVITCPEDITVTCDTTVTGAGLAIVTDNCDPSPSLTYTDNHVSGDCEWLCVIERAWTATDMWGNSSQCTQTIEKNTLPLIEEALSADTDGDGSTDTLVLGFSSTTLTVDPGSAACVLEWLPVSGGTPSGLKRGNQTIGAGCSPGTNPTTTDGKLANPLLAEVLKLEIILRLDPDLGATPLKNIDCDFAPIIWQSFRDDDTVNDFVDVANKALANLVLVPHLNELLQAIQCINEPLDVCKSKELMR